MKKDIKNVNKKLEMAAKQFNASEKDLEKFKNMANNYKNKSQDEVEAEMNKLIQGFSKEQKRALIKKMKMLKQMNDLLDEKQRRKIDTFISLLSR
ncbi:hypothetical protein IZY60_14750 [Lutibacter sp. B2]|nr:hypothetical protein [Lutibacter sp. B2]